MDGLHNFPAETIHKQFCRCGLVFTRWFFVAAAKVVQGRASGHVPCVLLSLAGAFVYAGSKWDRKMSAPLQRVNYRDAADRT